MYDIYKHVGAFEVLGGGLFAEERGVELLVGAVAIVEGGAAVGDAHAAAIAQLLIDYRCEIAIER